MSVIARLFEGLEERVVAFLFWSAVFVPLLLGAVTLAHKAQTVEVEDMLAGTGAEEGSVGEWSAIGPALTTWTPKPQPVTDAPVEAETKAGGDGQDGKDATEGGAKDANAKPGASGGAKREGTAAGSGSDPGSGKGEGDGRGSAVVRARPASAGGGGVAGAPKDCLPADPRIAKRSEAEYGVARDLVDYYAKHLQEFDDLAVTLAHTDEEGKPSGFRVTRMRCGNPLQQAGIKNGDIVRTVNGRKVNNTMQAASAYLKLRDEDHFRVEVERRGETVFLEYDITE